MIKGQQEMMQLTNLVTWFNNSLSVSLSLSPGLRRLLAFTTDQPRTLFRSRISERTATGEQVLKMVGSIRWLESMSPLR